MTRKQKQQQRRNEKIRELIKELTIEEVAEKFNLSIPRVYQIVQKEIL